MLCARMSPRIRNGFHARARLRDGPPERCVRMAWGAQCVCRGPLLLPSMLPPAAAVPARMEVHTPAHRLPSPLPAAQGVFTPALATHNTDVALAKENLELKDQARLLGLLCAWADACVQLAVCMGWCIHACMHACLREPTIQQPCTQVAFWREEVEKYVQFLQVRDPPPAACTRYSAPAPTSAHSSWRGHPHPHSHPHTHTHTHTHAAGD